MEHPGPGHRTRASYTVSSVLAALGSRWRRLDLGLQTLGIRHPRVKKLLRELHLHDKDAYGISDSAQSEGLLVASDGDATLRCLKRLTRVKLLSASQRSLVYCVIARVHMNSGRDADAESACRAAVAAGYSGDRAETLLVLSDDAYRAGRYRLAAALADLCLDPAPSDPSVAGRAHFLAGISHAKLFSVETASSKAATEHAESADRHFRSALYPTAGRENFERREAYKWLIGDSLTRGTEANLVTEFKRAMEDTSLDVSSAVLNELFDLAVSRCEQSEAWLEVAAILNASAEHVPVRLWRPGTEARWHAATLTLFSALNRPVPAAFAKSTSEGLAGTAPCSVFSKVPQSRCFSDTTTLLSASLPAPDVPDTVIQAGDQLLSEYLSGSPSMPLAYEDVLGSIPLDNNEASPSLAWLRRHAEATWTSVDTSLLQRRIDAANIICRHIHFPRGDLSPDLKALLTQVVMTKVVMQNATAATKHLEAAIDHLLLVAQIEQRIPILITVVLVSHHSGFTDVAYRLLQGTSAQIMQQPSMLLRIKWLLQFCSESRYAGLFKTHRSLFHGMVVQGEAEAFAGAHYDNGFQSDARHECERIEDQFRFLKSRF